MTTVQLISISVSTKGAKQSGTIHLSKYIVYTRCVQSLNRLYPNVEDNEDQISKIANFLKTANDLG